MNATQKAIYDKIHTWTEYAHGIGVHLVSEHYYYSWLLKSSIMDTTDQASIKRELRAMLDSGMIRARTVRIVQKNKATAYDADTSGETATILSLPEAEIDKIRAEAQTKKKRRK